MPRVRGQRRRPKRARITLSVVVIILVATAASILSTGISSSDQQSGAATGAATGAISPPKSWKLTFSSNFSGKKLNTSVWETCYPWSLNGCTNSGNGNEEKEWYQASQVHVKGGILYLTAHRARTVGISDKGKPKTYSCRSGMVTTFRKFHFTYGYIQIRARIPFGGGLWPALWLAAANEKWPPEVDVLEHWGTATISKVYLHPTKGPRQGAVFNAPTIYKSWHTFTLYWTNKRLTWYYDGRQILTTIKDIPQQAMYFIANLAVTNAGRGECSGTLPIKSIKVWQPRTTKK